MLDCYFTNDISRTTGALLEAMTRAEAHMAQPTLTAAGDAYLRGYRDAIRAVRIAFGVDMADNVAVMPAVRRRIEVRRG